MPELDGLGILFPTMNNIIQHPLPYHQDCSRLFAPISHEPWAMWLDSCALGGELGRFDIIVARPHTTLVTRDGVTTIDEGGAVREASGDPFSLLQQQLSRWCYEAQHTQPFCGGAVGYFSYDLARLIESLPAIALDDLHLPQMAVGLYDWAVVCDHQERHCRLISPGLHPDTRLQWQGLVTLFDGACGQADEEPSPSGFTACGEVTSNMSEAQYRQGFQRIKSYLKEGDCYQVNFAQRFSVAVNGLPWLGYLNLRRRNPAPFGAYLNTPHGQILSSSPERFLLLDGEKVETRPIKGTRPRGRDEADDLAMIEALQNSDKDRAENLMIVDLLRNDLGKCCRPGSIHVPRLFAIEHYATVHHMVSTIVGALSEGEDATTLLRNCFPGGSITGAPKLRAMEIIEELEPVRRGIYCGSIGYIGYDGRMDSNIAIRTVLHKDGVCYFSAGGGIVNDSVCDEEYRETFAKAEGILRVFQ